MTIGPGKTQEEFNIQSCSEITERRELLLKGRCGRTCGVINTIQSIFLRQAPPLDVSPYGKTTLPAPMMVAKFL